MKIPLSAWFVFGGAGLPAFGAVGCGMATALVMWGQVLIAWQVVRRDPFYAPFGLQSGGMSPPHRASLLTQLRLGVPMGASVLIEVTGFTFMAFFIARMGTTAVAATGTLVAQRLGAADPDDARRLGWHGLQIGLLIATGLGSAVYLGRAAVLGLYTGDAAIVASQTHWLRNAASICSVVTP